MNFNYRLIALWIFLISVYCLLKLWNVLKQVYNISRTFSYSGHKDITTIYSKPQILSSVFFVTPKRKSDRCTNYYFDRIRFVFWDFYACLSVCNQTIIKKICSYNDKKKIRKQNMFTSLVANISVFYLISQRKRLTHFVWENKSL